MHNLQDKSRASWDAGHKSLGQPTGMKPNSSITNSPPQSLGTSFSVPPDPLSQLPASADSSPPMMSDRPPILTLNEAAKFLRCSKAHLSNVVNGKVPSLPPFPCIQIGRRKLVRKESLMRWVESVESRRVLS
jgi:Helix-turn-helix domain